MALHCIVLSGGTGSRLGLEIPKQFLEIAGEPLLSRSFRSLLAWNRNGNFVCVAHPDFIEQSRSVLAPLCDEFQITITFVAGGTSRHASTLCGIDAIQPSVADDDLILIHDGARPLLTKDELDRLVDAFDDPAVGIASLASPITDTVVRGRGLPGVMIERLDRSELFSIKTPQAFRASLLASLLGVPESERLTDLLSWGEEAGILGTLVRAGDGNIKLTHRSDIALIERFLDET